MALIFGGQGFWGGLSDNINFQVLNFKGVPPKASSGVHLPPCLKVPT